MRNWPAWIVSISLLLVATPLAAAAGIEPRRDQEPALLSDEELAGVTAGDFSVNLDGFDVVIQENAASAFTLDIAQSAFNSAQGVFTTLQAVNSAVNLSVVVNIYLNGQST
jgi:hypothetical protein